METAHPKKYQVLIVNYAFWEGVSRLPSVLHQAGCEVSAITHENNYIAHCGFVDNLYTVANDVNQMVNFLEEHLKANPDKYDWVVLGDDPLLYTLAEKIDEPWVQKIYPTHLHKEGVKFMSSKAFFIEQAHKHGVPVPKFQLCSTASQLKAAAAELGFPLVVKDSQGFSGEGVKIIKDAAMLDKVNVTEEMIAQEFVTGKVGSAAALFSHGKLIAWFSYYRARTWGPLGASTAIQYQVFPQLQSALEKLGELSGYHGPCGIDFIHSDATDEVVLLEQNFRPTLTISLGANVGVNFVKMFQAFLSNQPEAITFKQNPNIHRCIPLFPLDVFRTLDERDILGLLKWFVWVPWWPQIMWNDPKLLKFHVGQIIHRLLQKTVLRNTSKKAVSTKLVPSI